MTARVSPQSLIGKNGIPTPYIEKVVLQPATRPSGETDNYGKTIEVEGLLVTVGVVLMDVAVRNKFQWSQNERLLKYMRLRIVESVNPKLTLALADKGFTRKNLNKAKRSFNAREQILPISVVPNIRSYESFKPDDVATAYMVPYEVQFFMPKSDPEHLAYFCSCFLDTAAMRSDLDANFKNKRFREVQGYVTAELVANNSTLRSETSLFRLPTGKIWTGPIHIHRRDGGRVFMAGPTHTSRKHPTLDRIQIPNFKVQDHRFIQKLLNLEYRLGREKEAVDIVLKDTSDVGYATSTALSLGLTSAGTTVSTSTSIASATNPSELFSKKENFISEAFLSRSADGTSNLVFSFDQRRMLQKNARFGAMLTTRNDDVLKEVRKNCRILSLKVLRTRVQNDFQLNKEAEELIVFNAEGKAGQFADKLYSVDRDGDEDKVVPIGYIKEVDLLNAQQMRSFSCTDFSMTNITDGEFRYSVEVEVEDGTVTYILNLLKKLKDQKQALIRYYNLAQRPNHYDAVTNKFKKRFLDQNSVDYPNLSDEEINNGPNLARQKRSKRTLADAPWNRSIVILMEVLGAVTNLSSLSNKQLEFAASSLHSMVNPLTGSPEGIEALIRLYEHAESNIRKSISSRNPIQIGDPALGQTEVDLGVRSSMRKERFKRAVISTRKDFHETFVASTLKGVFYDFLGGQNTNQGGMREVPFDFLRRRFRRENNKYFKGDLQQNSDPLLDLKQTEFSYLSPAKINYDIGSLDLLSAGKSLWNRDGYNKASLALSAINLNPSTVGATTPLGSATLYNGESDIQNVLSQGILASNNITIEPTVSSARTGASSQNTESEDLLGENTNREITKQVTTQNSTQDEKEQNDNQERSRKEQGRTLAPINNVFVQKILNKKNRDFFAIARDKGIAAGLAGFDTRKSNNIIEKLYRTKTNGDIKVRNLPNQIKSLFLSSNPNAANKWFDADVDFLLNPETLEMFRYNFFTLQRIEYLDGFEITEADGAQITKPIFRTMDPRRIPLRRGTTILCKMVTYKNNLVYAGIPDELSAPILDEYFLLRIGGESTKEENRQIRRTPASDGRSLDAFQTSPVLTLSALTNPSVGGGATPDSSVSATDSLVAALPPTVSDTIVGAPASTSEESRQLQFSAESPLFLLSEGPAVEAERRLSELASLSPVAIRLMRVLLNKDRRLMPRADRIVNTMRYMLYATTVAVKQPIDLILLGAQIGTLEDPRRTRIRSTSDDRTNRIIGQPVTAPERELATVATSDALTLGLATEAEIYTTSTSFTPPATSGGGASVSESGYTPPPSTTPESDPAPNTTTRTRPAPNTTTRTRPPSASPAGSFSGGGGGY